MKITVDDQLFDTIPGLCIGVVALRAADNRDVNLEAEAFRRRCCTEANLLLKMNPHIADQEIERYQNVLKKLSITGESGLAKTFAEYKKDLGLFEKEEAAETPMEILPAPKTATLDELAGSDVLPRRNPILDMVRAGMLKFHVDIQPTSTARSKADLTRRASSFLAAATFFRFGANPVMRMRTSSVAGVISPAF